MKLDIPARATRPIGLIDGQLIFHHQRSLGVRCRPARLPHRPRSPLVEIDRACCDPERDLRARARARRSPVASMGLTSVAADPGQCTDNVQRPRLRSTRRRASARVGLAAAGAARQRQRSASPPTSDRGDHAYLVTVTGFLTPTTFAYTLDAGRGPQHRSRVKTLPAKFDASQDDLVEQHEAVSSDGTKHPLFSSSTSAASPSTAARRRS